ncbi:hypothetical protein ACWD4L_15690 [Streptomyces sp. NPDC002596]
MPRAQRQRTGEDGGGSGRHAHAPADGGGLRRHSAGVSSPSSSSARNGDTPLKPSPTRTARTRRIPDRARFGDK